MRTTAAVVHEVGRPLETEELDLAGPREGEVLVRFTHAGLCHSDLHVIDGDIAGWLPMVLGHEGVGVVEDGGPGVTRVARGDHVVCSFIPSCRSCHWCATGQQAICDAGAEIMRGCLPGGSWPLSGPAGRYGAMCMLGTFSQYGVVHQFSTVRMPSDLPLDVAALVGCGVPTGWGSAVNAADVRPGQTVVIYGVGGIGINAVQGARHAGAQYVVAVDRWRSSGRKALELGKSGTVVLVSMGGGFRDRTIQLPAQVATLWKKTVKGSLFGDCNPTADIPRLLGLYRSGDLELDGLITRRYPLEHVHEHENR